MKENEIAKHNQNNYFSTEPTYMELGGGLTAEVRKPIEQDSCNVEKERLQVVISDKKGRDYYADFVTLRYLDGVMGESKKEGELANGSYFPGQNRIVIKDLSKKTVSKVLEDIIETRNLEFYFKDITD
jgi:hypothetical protein